MKLKFTKMHGLGNDFMVIDGVNQNIKLDAKMVKNLANRHTGVGFDQLLLVEKPKNSKADFYYRIYNADGHEVAQCGNGARCLALFLQSKNLSNKTEITVQTHTKEMILKIDNDGSVTIDMGEPIFSPKLIPISFDRQENFYQIPTEFGVYHVHAVNTGNPHAVMLVNDVSSQEVLKIGQAISTHKLFPEEANVGFMQIVDNNSLKLRVYERGAGETLACGSGAVAAVAAACKYHGLAEEVTVHLKLGELKITWPKKTGPIFMSGPAQFVYEGELCA